MATLKIDTNVIIVFVIQFVVWIMKFNVMRFVKDVCSMLHYKLKRVNKREEIMERNLIYVM